MSPHGNTFGKATGCSRLHSHPKLLMAHSTELPNLSLFHSLPSIWLAFGLPRNFICILWSRCCPWLFTRLSQFRCDPLGRKEHGTRPVLHLDCDKDLGTAGPLGCCCCSWNDEQPRNSVQSPRTSLQLVGQLSSSLLPTLAAGTKCSQAPAVIPWGTPSPYVAVRFHTHFQRAKKCTP